MRLIVLWVSLILVTGVFCGIARADEVSPRSAQLIEEAKKISDWQLFGSLKPEDMTEAKMKRNFKLLMRTYHPDRWRNEDEKAFANYTAWRINTARDYFNAHHEFKGAPIPSPTSSTGPRAATEGDARVKPASAPPKQPAKALNWQTGKIETYDPIGKADYSASTQFGERSDQPKAFYWNQNSVGPYDPKSVSTSGNSSCRSWAEAVLRSFNK